MHMFVAIVMLLFLLSSLGCWLTVVIAAFSKEKSPAWGLAAMVPCCVPLGFIIGWIKHEAWGITGVMGLWTTLIVLIIAGQTGAAFFLPPLEKGAAPSIFGARPAVSRGGPNVRNFPTNSNGFGSEAANKPPSPAVSTQPRVETQPSVTTKPRVTPQPEVRNGRPVKRFGVTEAPRKSEASEASETSSASQRANEFRRQMMGNAEAQRPAAKEAEMAEAEEEESDLPQRIIEAGEATDLDPPEIALPPLKYTYSKANRSEAIGSNYRGAQFIERAPSGSAMVGFEIGTAGEGAFQKIKYLVPIFQKQDKYLYGRLVGDDRATPNVLLAKPGFVLTGVAATSGIGLSSFQCKFSKFDSATGKIDKDDFYLSDAVGRTFGSSKSLDSRDHYVVGMYGRKDKAVTQFGLTAIKARADKTLMSSVDYDGFRTWTSRDGKHSFEARLEDVEDGKAVLVNRDGREVRVDIEKLTLEDRKLIERKF